MASASSPRPAPAASSSAPPHKAGEHAEDGNQVWVSVHKRVSLYVDIALRMMKQHDHVELRGLGAALAATIEVASQLLHVRRATLVSIRTATTSSKPELMIVLQRVGEADHGDEDDELIQLTEDTHMHAGSGE